MKKNILFFISLIISLNLFSQGKKIIIIGKDLQNKYRKTLKLAGLSNEKYYSNFSGLSETIKNNQYTYSISGSKDNIPKPFYFILETENPKVFKTSNVFYISNGINKINFNSDSGKVIFNKNNTSYEDINEFNNYMESYSDKKTNLYNTEGNIYKKKNFNVEQKTKDSIQKLYIELDQYEDTLLLDLSKKEPKSYVLFWKVVGKFESKGFRKEYYQIYNNLDQAIKKSSAGLIFKRELEKAEKIISGNVFPDLVFQNKNILSSLGRKFTIIDFWFSHCEPCLKDFPKYKNIYSNYKDKGVEIIGISTDQTKNIAAWEKVIKEKNLPWIHLLDENGTESKKYNINTFPTTFLLDSQGTIIKKNISPEEIEVFLGENL